MNAQAERELKLVDDAAAKLMEHFDTVQIFTTRHSSEEDGTINVVRGFGNWFARYGQIREWLVKEDESARSRIIRHVEIEQ